MKVLLTGANGQLGEALKKFLPSNINLIPLTRNDLDLSDLVACKKCIHAHEPDWVINAAAYTGVDQAEHEENLAMTINAHAPLAFAEGLAETGGRLLQISTDFVFNGLQSHPYLPDQAVNPIGVYGRSKALGEQSVNSKLGKDERVHILRTSWIYGPLGKNFCLTMLRLHALKASEGKSLGVVADQVGCPTSSHRLAQACWSVIHKVQEGKVLPGFIHWSDNGVASWYDFAVAIGQLGASIGLLSKKARVIPIRTIDYPTPAKRPSYSLLDISTTSGLLELNTVHWRDALEEVLYQIKAIS